MSQMPGNHPPFGGPMGAPSMDQPVVCTFPLSFQWQVVDPFLFCVHHLDTYPAANGNLGPAASLEGRDIGQDFEGKDGWRMYHGENVPGFPRHPHRGFETVTFVRRGLVDHSDSMGATARYGRGDVQWMTAGAGVVHSEMFPLLDNDGPNTTELFQIWINLPAADKMAEPFFSMFWDADIPRHIVTDDAGRRTEITVVAGSVEGVTALAPPPASWASKPESDLAIWHLEFEPGATWTMPPASGGMSTSRVLYLYEGSTLSIGERVVPAPEAAVVMGHLPLSLTAGDGGVKALLLQGKGIGEPVAQWGPFVMNDRDGVVQAMQDYQSTGFGGWPWPSDDPAHGTDPTRFALRPDGTRETAPT